MKPENAEGGDVGCNRLLGEPTPKDWLEDWPHENGDYACLCVECGSQFVGHKRRVTCKECAENEQARRDLDDVPPMFGHWKKL